MPIYNNPAIGQSFENIARMFAPPSSGDLANYALARGRNQQSDIVARLAGDPNYQGFDRQAILADLYDPTSSFYAVDSANATTRRGQDITASTSRANNLQDNRFKTISSLFGPLDQGQVRPALPADVTSAMGLPAVPEAVGAPKALTKDQVEGGLLQAATAGQTPTLSQEQLTALLMGNTPTQNIVGPSGPEVVYTPQAVGQQPYFNKGAEAKQDLYSYITPDQRRGTAVLSDDGKLHDTQSGAVLPEGTRAAKANVQGTAAEVGLAPTVANQTDANNQRAEITRTLGLLDLYEGIVKNDPSAIGLAGSIKGLVQNTLAVSQDLANSFGASVPQLQEFSNELRTDLGKVAPEYFDPNIPAADFLVGALAYGLARTENPAGEVSRQAFESAKSRVAGGALANSQSAQAAVDAFRQMLNSQLKAVGVLDQPGSARTDTTYQGTAPDSGGEVTAVNPTTGERLKLVNGQWVPVQ